MKRIVWTLAILLVLAASTGIAVAAERRVVKDNPLAAYPYDTWSNAAASIQMAIDAADPGDTILVTNGVYDTGGRTAAGSSLTNRVTIDRAVSVIAHSTNPADTVIVGAWDEPSPNGPNAVRCVYMAEGAFLAGFTLTNGATLAVVGNDGRAGGVFCEGAAAVVSNSVIVDPSAYRDAASGYYGTYYDCRFLRSHGGGIRHISRATLYRCDIIGKYPDDYYDGGVVYCTLYDSLITRCWQKYAGGASASTLYNCRIIGNRGGTAYGGVSGSTLYNCIIASNSTARTGAGIRDSTAVNCRIFDNEGDWYGAGAFESTLYNCLVYSNRVSSTSSGGQGSGAYASTLYNCTVVENSTVVAGDGGVFDSTVFNSIIWNNRDTTGVVNYAGSTVFTNSCTTPVPAGGWDVSNIADDPRFANAPSGDYRLAAGSPCTDKGLNFAWMQDPDDARSRDLDGNPRILPRGGRVDIGAFERNMPQGTVLGIR